MELNKYDSIQDLTSARFDWKCRVRLQCLWRGANIKTKEFWGLNMILIDDSNNRIQCFASAKYCKDAVNELKEGRIYVFSNFKVKDYVGDETYCPVRNKKHIYFTTHTKVELNLETDLPIERHAFDLFYMGEMEKMAKDNRFLIDVVGQIKNMRANMKSTKSESDKILTKFDLFDGRHSLGVTLFDEFGINFEQTLKRCNEANIFVIISAVKIGMFEGAPQLTNYAATRFYINPNHYSINLIRDRTVGNINEPLRSPPTQDINFPTMHVKDIQSLPPNSVECKVKCQVRVTKVEEQSSWFYAVCTKCPNEIVQDQGIYKCLHCKRIIPYPDKRFRLCTLCTDGTGSIAIIFPDEEVTRILDKTVFDIEAEIVQQKTEGKFPHQLKQFENKLFNITLEITSNNLNKGSRVYDAYEIGDKIESGANFDPTAVKDSEMPDNATVDDDNNNTPHTGISSTKTRPRTIMELVAFDPKGETPTKFMRKDEGKQ